MYNTWTRVNAIFFYGVTALFFAAAASNITTIWFTPTPVVTKMALKDMKSLKPMREPAISRSQTNDRAVFTFDLEADLRGVFNWNVKQLFVYVTADYETRINKVNEVVIWDYVVQNRSQALLSVKDSYVKYPLLDQGKDLRGVPVSLTLHWDVMPITGKLYIDTKGSVTVKMPDSYCSEMDGPSGRCKIEPPIAVALDGASAAA